MRKGKTLIGKDVLSLAGGRKLHSVKDVIIGGDGTEIVALLVDEGGLLSTSRVVPIEYVESFGKDAVVISESRGVIPADQYPRVKQTLDRRDRLVGKKVFTEAGDDHGTIGDMYFDEETGRILGFEVSGGFVNNVARGTMYLPIEDIVRTGPDVVYIRAEAVDALHSQSGGLQSALSGAQEKAGGALGTAQEKAGQVQQQMQPEQQLVGQRAPYDIEDDNGNVLVAAGQRVDQSHIERLRERGKLDQVLVQAGLKQPSTGPGVGAQASTVAGQAADTAGSLWDQFQRKVQDMTDATGKRMDERQTKQLLADIEDAVGRPVTKVLLDRQDNVILNLGDIITHQAVQRAHEAGALDSLLKSVYKADVQFSREELMAPPTVEATATIEKATGDAPLVDELQTKVETAEQERQQQKEESRTQSEQEREQREQERQQRAQEREQQSQETQAAQQQAQQEQQQNRQTWEQAQQEEPAPDGPDTLPPQESLTPVEPPADGSWRQATPAATSAQPETTVFAASTAGAASAPASVGLGAPYTSQPTEYPDPMMTPEVPAATTTGGYDETRGYDTIPSLPLDDGGGTIEQSTEYIETQPADRSGAS